MAGHALQYQVGQALVLRRHPRRRSCRLGLCPAALAMFALLIAAPEARGAVQSVTSSLDWNAVFAKAGRTFADMTRSEPVQGRCDVVRGCTALLSRSEATTAASDSVSCQVGRSSWDG